MSVRALVRHSPKCPRSSAAPRGAARNSSSARCLGARLGSPAASVAAPASLSTQRSSRATLGAPRRSAFGSAVATTSPIGWW